MHWRNKTVGSWTSAETFKIGTLHEVAVNLLHLPRVASRRHVHRIVGVLVEATLPSCLVKVLGVEACSPILRVRLREILGNGLVASSLLKAVTIIIWIILKRVAID